MAIYHIVGRDNGRAVPAGRDNGRAAPKERSNVVVGLQCNTKKTCAAIFRQLQILWPELEMTNCNQKYREASDRPS